MIMIQAAISTFLREIFFDCRINVVAIEINDLASTFIAFENIRHILHLAS